MISQIHTQLKTVNYRLLFALLLVGFVPTLYSTLRIFFLGQIPAEYSFSIAGQLSWINLLYEIINESVILPLYYFLGRSVLDKSEFINRVKSGMLVVFVVYLVLSLLIILFVNPLLDLMAVNDEILSESATYISFECVAMIFSVLTNFALVALTSLNKTKHLCVLTGLRLFFCIVFDVILISPWKISLNLGVNGIAICNIIVNCLILFISIFFLKREGIDFLKKQKLSFIWMKEFWKIGRISGLESFVRNIAYMLMIVRMVNVVNEQGTYWVANSFIWGWLLLPITQLGEYIRKDVATDKDAVKKKTPGYFAVTSIVVLLWFVSIPVWKPFMSNILLLDNVDKLFNLVLILLVFYVVYAFQNVFDSVFYGLGKTNYMLFESIVTNCLYYGMAFVLYLLGVWKPSLTGIALLFGFGTMFDGIVSFGVYLYMLKNKRYL